MTQSHSARRSSTKAGHNPELDLAREFVCHTDKCIFLTGKAGTGKTTFLRTLKTKPPKRLAVVAPTGVAAINAGGQTIHSLFQLPFGPIVPGNKRDQRQYRRLSNKKVKLLRALDLLIIDEISMVRADVLDGIDEVLRRYRTPYKPFGGVQLLMIGDLHQLPPVVKDEDWDMLRTYYDTPFFFSSRALQQTEPVTVQLKHIYRQSDEDFIHLLNKVRNNKLDESVLEKLNSRYKKIDELPDRDAYITLTTHNRTAQNINAEQLAALPQEEHRFEAEVKGDFPAHAYPAEEDLRLKLGAQVMFIKNDKSTDRRYYNGKIGKITAIDEDDGITVKCPGDDFHIKVSREEWHNRKYKLNERIKEVQEDVVGTFTQYPLRLAWAITIHKSQGLTFERVILDAKSAFAHGQVYVALSRCKTFEGIVLRSRIELSSVRTDNKVQRFSEEAERNAPGEAQLLNAKIAFQRSLLQELFDFRFLQKHLEQARRALLEHEHRLLPGAVEPFQKVLDFAENELYPVAMRFQQQLAVYFQQDGLPEAHQGLQKRVKQAAEWFAEQLQAGCLGPMGNVKVVTDNQMVESEITEALEQVWEAFFVKHKLLLQTQHAGFSATHLLKTKTEAALDYKQQTQRQQPTTAQLDTDNIAHPELLQQLIEWRSAKGKEQQLPLYRILTNKSLVDITQNLPGSSAQLRKTHGIGRQKIEQYGEELVSIVNGYCNEKGVTPMPPATDVPPAKRKVKSANTKEKTLALYKSGKSIAEIAEERELVESTIEGHFVYFIEQGQLSATEFLATEAIQDIKAQASSIEDFTLKALHQHFDGAYSYGQLRMALANNGSVDAAVGTEDVVSDE